MAHYGAKTIEFECAYFGEPISVTYWVTTEEKDDRIGFEIPDGERLCVSDAELLREVIEEIVDWSLTEEGQKKIAFFRKKAAREERRTSFPRPKRRSAKDKSP
jgi:hypothetical protein